MLMSNKAVFNFIHVQPHNQTSVDTLEASANAPCTSVSNISTLSITSVSTKQETYSAEMPFIMDRVDEAVCFCL